MDTLTGPVSHFQVLPVVALCDQGMPIAPESLSEIAACSYEPCHEDDPNICRWGVYVLLLDLSMEHICDCPKKEFAATIADALNRRHCMIAQSRKIESVVSNTVGVTVSNTEIVGSN